MSKFKFLATKELQRHYKSFRKDLKTQQKIDDVIFRIIEDPFSKELRTHQVNIPVIGKCWSSRITGDLRILWTFSKEDVLVIIGLKIGGHDDVYR